MTNDQERWFPCIFVVFSGQWCFKILASGPLRCFLLTAGRMCKCDV